MPNRPMFFPFGMSRLRDLDQFLLLTSFSGETEQGLSYTDAAVAALRVDELRE